ncbi:hypothetical protein AB5N19_11385 [Seiridium cardinale]|uniref:2EXR domain-containing protein n=1 Tax=Seiridium cardinale TaxID=138064 RepID=A0ABR2X9X7_9PEZI
MSTVASFHLFPRLPTELKLKIYRLALTPRTVPVRLKLDLDAWNWSTEKDWWTCYSVVADAECPRTVLPAVLSARYEAWKELKGLYGGLRIDRAILETLLETLSESGDNRESQTTEVIDDEGVSLDEGGPRSSRKSDNLFSKRLVENLLSMQQERRRPPFNRHQDVLMWKDTQRWVSCGDTQLQTLVHPLFLASCLSVRHVRIEYVSCMANLLEVLAFGVLDERRELDSLDLSVRNPSDCRVLRFKLCRTPAITTTTGDGRSLEQVMGKSISDTKVEDLVKTWGLVWFPWFRGYANHIDDKRQSNDLVQHALSAITSPSIPPLAEPSSSTPSPLSTLFRSATFKTVNTAILQVLSPLDPTTGPGASGSWARLRALADPSKVSFQYPYSDEPLKFGMGDLQADVLLWCHAMKLHGAGYPANLPFSIVGVPCHGFCGEEDGMTG